MRAWISFLAAIPSLAAQEEPEHKPHPGVDSFRVNLAIDRGSRFLLEKNSFAEWGSPGEKLREHDLVLYTLFHAGVKPELKRFQELLEKILESELQTTYTVSLQAMLLQELDPDKYRWRLAQICQFLVDNQSQNGQWPYGEPTKIPKDTPTFSPPQKDDIATSGNKRKKKPRKQKPIRIRAQRTGVEKGDNSNAQYALLGLRACMEANVWPPRESLERSLKWWHDAQQTDGGWSYQGRGGTSYGSMTAGAVGSVIILQHYLKRKWKRDISARKGVDWIGKEFSVTENPHKTGWYHYYLYTLERAGILTGLNIFGKHDWYKDGANHLLDSQKSDGSWGNVRSTCFAILFLKRATPPLKKVATGR